MRSTLSLQWAIKLSTLLLPVALAAPAEVPTNATANASADSSTTGGGSSANTYDYVIVGGGLTGLVVAARLSEDRTSE